MKYRSFKPKTSLFLAFFLLIHFSAFAQLDKTILQENVVFQEVDGLVTVEAEYFYKQSKSEIRKWYRTSKNESPASMQDLDEAHVAGASNNAYIEILPDTRATHDDKLIRGENFTNTPGEMAVLHYRVHFNTPGKYYVWVRAFSTGSEDNGIHVGLDGEWPESGARMQWCSGKHSWTWESKQRTEEVHCGEPYLIFLEIKEAGEHDIQFSMREDGFEFDKFLLTTNRNFKAPTDAGPSMNVKSGTLPAAYPMVKEVKAPDISFLDYAALAVEGTHLMKAVDFPIDGSNFYIDRGDWLAINPEEHKEGIISKRFMGSNGEYDVVFIAVGENDGSSQFKLWLNQQQVGDYEVPLSIEMFEESSKYCQIWEQVSIQKRDTISVWAHTGTDGKEYSRARWAGVAFVPVSKGEQLVEKLKKFEQNPKVAVELINSLGILPAFSDPSTRLQNGDGSVEISGELKEWHKVTLTLDGPFAHELDKNPNPFTDYNMTVTFRHESGSPVYKVPGYFAADGNAAESSADRGTKWRAHLSPDKTGKWTYKISFKKGLMAYLPNATWANQLEPYHGKSGDFMVSKTDKTGKDFRSKGRLEYVGKHHLQFKGSGEYFLKAGADAPETLLGYADFDATYTTKPNVPVKKFEPHIQDWKEGDPSWKGGKGKGLIGALNYLSSKGLNTFSFLSYNAGGDGDNVWPFVDRDVKLHYDCSKLDQWALVFDHAQSLGLHCHFKTQENENDDLLYGHDREKQNLTVALDEGFLGPERMLYYRELIARFSHLLALNWNLGEENTQTTQSRKDMAQYLLENCPYPHNIVMHSYPDEIYSAYFPLLGEQSALTGVSIQTGWQKVHETTLNFRKYSTLAEKPWVVANDEQNPASGGVPPDPGYENYDEALFNYSIHDIRKQTLWGNLMGGGAGVEYYFGYKLPQNDLICEDFRSRDLSWDYCNTALTFFIKNKIPFWQMANANGLIENANNQKEKYCLAKPGELYLVYLGYTQTSSIDLSTTEGTFQVEWFNPRTGGELVQSKIKKVKGGEIVQLGKPPYDANEDWLVLLKKK